MNKIVRLSWANIRKRKLEAVSLLVLTMLCMLLMGSSLSAITGLRDLFPQIMEHTGSYENYLLITASSYDPEYEEILRRDDRVEEVNHGQMLYSYGTSYLDPAGKEQALYLAFITQAEDQRFERCELKTDLTEAELAAIEHPVYMPDAAKLNMGMQCGDTFDVIYGTRKYHFTIAGFYDTLLFDTAGMGLKLVVNEDDYRTLESVLTRYQVLVYNDHQGQGGDKLLDEFLEACEAYSNKDVKSGAIGMYYEAFRQNAVLSIDYLLKIIVAMAVIIIVAVAFMIRFRITADIKEQIISIGVLEALGYTSKDITLSYVIEYLLVTLAGVIPGVAGCFLVTPALLGLGNIVTGHYTEHTVPVLPIALTAVVLLLFVSVIALLRASAVRHYPPVRAFRKGQGDHRFGRNHLPLRNTKHSVHLRLAMKGFLHHFRQNLGLTVCITISSIAVVFSFILFSFFSFNLNAIANSSGIELSDMRIDLMPGDDADALAQELSAMPEVRKATPTSGEEIYVTYDELKRIMLPVSFSDFNLTENIIPASGRFPEHDNEVMVTVSMGKVEGLHIGDSITLSYCNVKRKYIISGFVTSLTNGGVNLYIREDGMKRLIPTYRPGTVEVYLADDVDADSFRKTVTSLYGKSISEAAEFAPGEGSYEERIRAEADKQIAELMGIYGTSHVEYAIQSGDTVITGNSSAFRIRSVQSLRGILETQLAGISAAISAAAVMFTLVSALVVMIILFILMESSVRKSRRELGIMKGMGYTSKELMLQLACRIMPAALFSVIAGTAVSVMATGLLTSYIGKVAINVPVVVAVDIALLLFCFGCAYFGARKIKTISVYELMTE